MALLAPAARPTAIFAGNDNMAMGAYRAARRLGLRIPDDLSLVGFDDAEYAPALDPPAQDDLASAQLRSEVVAPPEPDGQQVASLVAGHRLDPLEAAPGRERPDVPDRDDDGRQLAELDRARQAGDAEMRRRDLGDRAADACQRRRLLELEQRPLKNVPASPRDRTGMRAR